MSYHDPIIEDSRIRFSKQLEQIRTGCSVMVPRLSEEEIKKYTKMNKNTKADERRPVLLEIGPALYELCSESDDDEEIVRRPAKITCSIQTITLTDSDDDEEPLVIAGTSHSRNSTSSPVTLDETNVTVRNTIDTIPTNLRHCIENQRGSTTLGSDAYNTYLPSTSATAVISNKNSSDEAGQKNVIESECEIVPSSPAKDIDSNKNVPLESCSKSVILSLPEIRKTSNIQISSKQVDTANSKEESKSDSIVYRSETCETQIETKIDSDEILATMAKLKALPIVCTNQNLLEVISNKNVSKETSENYAITSDTQTRDTSIKINIDSNETSATRSKLNTPLTFCTNPNTSVVNSNKDVSKEESDTITSHNTARETPINNLPKQLIIKKTDTACSYPKIFIPNHPINEIIRDCTDIASNNKPTSATPVNSNTTSDTKRSNDETIPPVLFNLKKNGLTCTPLYRQKPTQRTESSINCVNDLFGKIISSMIPSTKPTDQSSSRPEKPWVILSMKPNNQSSNQAEKSSEIFLKKPSDQSCNRPEKSSVIFSTKPSDPLSNRAEKSSVILSMKPSDQSSNRPEKSSTIPSWKPSDQSSNWPEKSSMIPSSKPSDQLSNQPKNLSMPSLDLEALKQDAIPCTSVMQPLKLRVKSGAKLGIKNPEFSLLKPTSPMDVNAAVDQTFSLLNTTSPVDANAPVDQTFSLLEPTSPVDVNAPVDQIRREINENIARIAAQMKQHYLAKTAHDNRNRNFVRQSQDGNYSEVRKIEMDTEKNAYQDGVDRRYSEMILFLQECIDRMNPISLFCQIYTNFQEIMPSNLKKQTVACFFVDVMYHLLYDKCNLNTGLHLRIPENEFCNVVSEIRQMFDLPKLTTRKRTIPSATPSTQMYNIPTISQQPHYGEVPNKVARAETLPYALISSEQPPVVNLISNQAAQNMNRTAPSRFSGPTSHLGNSHAQYPSSARFPINYLARQNIVHARCPPAYNSNIIVREKFPEITRYLGSNSHVNRFPNPPPYPHTLVQPEITSNMVYQRNCNGPRELIHHRVISTETIVCPGTSDRLSPAGVHHSVSQSYSFPPPSAPRMSPPVNPYSSMQPPVSTHQSHYVYPSATNRRNYPSNHAFNSIHPSCIPTTTFEPYSNQYSRTVPTRMAPTSMNEHLYQPSNSWNNNQTLGRNLNTLNTTDQGYLSMINNLNTNLRVPSTVTTIPMQPSSIPHQTNRVTTVVERSQYVSTQVDGTPKNVYNARNESSQNLAFPSQPSFAPMYGDKPLSVHVVNSSISPSTGSSPNLVSSSEMPISVPIVQSSSSPNIEQICDFETFGNMTEPFLKDSEYEEIMKTTDLNVRFDDDGEHRNNVRLN